MKELELLLGDETARVFMADHEYAAPQTIVGVLTDWRLWSKGEFV